MTAREQLLSDIEDFIAKHGLRPTQFGVLAMNDPAFVSRVRKGGNVRIDTAEKLRTFMAQYTPPKRGRVRGNEPRAAA